MKINKKGVLGLETAKLFFLAVLVLAVIGFLIIIIMSTLDSTTDGILPTKTGAQVQNETTTGPLNETGVLLGNNFRKDCTATVLAAYNGTEEKNVISSANYTVAGCRVSYSHASANVNINNTVWNVTYTFTFKDSSATNVLGNVSAGTEEFFGNATTWFTLLAVVIIILIIALVIIAVNRFSGTTGGGTVSVDEGL